MKKHKIYSLCALCLMWLFATTVQAQVTGTVVEAATDIPVIGATVIEVGTTNGTVTDFDGNFMLDVISVSKRKLCLPRTVWLSVWQKRLNNWKKWS